MARAPGQSYSLPVPGTSLQVGPVGAYLANPQLSFSAGHGHTGSTAVANVADSIWRVRSADLMLNFDYQPNPIPDGDLQVPLLVGGKSFCSLQFGGHGVYSAPQVDLQNWREGAQGWYIPGWRQMFPVDRFQQFPALRPWRLHFTLFADHDISFAYHTRRQTFLQQALQDFCREEHEIVLKLRLQSSIYWQLQSPEHHTARRLFERVWVANAEARSNLPYGSASGMLETLGLNFPPHGFTFLHLTWW